MTRPVAVGLLLLCTALWGLAFVFQKGAMDHMEPLTFAGVRYVLGAFLVLPLAIWEYRRRVAEGIVITPGQWQRIAWLSVAFFLGVWLQQVALLTTSVTNGGFITSLYVIFTPIGWIRRWREDPLNRRMGDGKRSNWILRERKPVDPARYRHQF